MAVDKKRTTQFDVTPDRLFGAAQRYVADHATYYTVTKADAATRELDVKLHPGFFAYDGDVKFTIAPKERGSELTIEVHTGPLFVVDWLKFWERYLVHVTDGVRALLS